MAEMKAQQKVWAKIVAKAWTDEDYKQRLLDDPATVLKAEGAELPEGVAFKCVEATESQAWLVLPPKPTEGSIQAGEERLAATKCFSPTCY
jgi:hypothetical protein